MTDFSESPLESVIEVDGIVRRTLEKLNIETVLDLANLDLAKAATLWGVGQRKLEVIEQLIAQARLALKLEPGESKSLLSQVPAEYGKQPLLFIPQFLSWSFEGMKITTVGDLLKLQIEELHGQPGWGD
jgi:hypothetical protein